MQVHGKRVHGKHDARVFLSEQMTRAQGLKLKRLSQEAYQPAQFARDLSFTEAAQRIQALEAEIALANSF
ncbi:DUF3072 domain-containing protein [Bradyrhizobium sp.]|uniref:DUF3072 domain-containing protein n=1 Tax=Bradyrhizobium sp. TaxID=376 RepID=UPI0025BB21F6|nr:DUF3072 domain-containing protein [Bradyrhizobium sp.]